MPVVAIEAVSPTPDDDEGTNDKEEGVAGAEAFRGGKPPRPGLSSVDPGGCFLGGMAGGKSSSPHEGVRDPEDVDTDVEDQTFSCD